VPPALAIAAASACANRWIEAGLSVRSMTANVCSGSARPSTVIVADSFEGDATLTSAL
jgi:hypothetical protein